MIPSQIFYKYSFAETAADLNEVVTFEYNSELYEKHVATPEKIKDSVRDPEVLAKVESTFRGWFKKVEVVLIQFQQLRRENEFMGPVVEIEYWRKQLAKFSSIVEFTKTTEFTMHIQFLNSSESRILKVSFSLTFRK